MDNQPEKIDSGHAGDGTSGAAYLVAEYRLAFGKDWKIWAGRKDQEPQDEPTPSYARF